MINSHQKPPKWLTVEQIKLFFHRIYQRSNDSFMIEKKYDRVKWRAVFGLIYRYGLRVGECSMLDVEDVRLYKKTILIRRLKGGISREFPLMEDMIEPLDNWLVRREAIYAPADSGKLFFNHCGNALGSHGIAAMFKALMEECGILGYSVHSLRHSIAVHMLSSGIDLVHVRDLLGHTNMQTTLIYAQIVDKVRSNYIAKINNEAGKSFARV
jgi:site-specific recombinase XerD